MLFRSLVRYGAGSVYGPDIPLAVFVVIMKLFQIVLNIGIGIAAGAQPIVGYNYGAGQYGRVRELLKLMLKWTAIICLLCTVLFEAAPQAFICMFGSDGELYTQFATCLLYTSSSGYSMATSSKHRGFEYFAGVFGSQEVPQWNRMGLPYSMHFS